MEKKLKGVVVPIPTPLDENENIDLTGLEKLIDHLIGNKVDGIFILGTMGEFAALTEKQKDVLVGNTVKEVNGKIKIYCGIGDCGTRRVIENARMIQKHKIDAMVPVLPYYYPQRREGENRKFLSELFENVETPVIFYENPIMTRRKLSQSDFQWLMEQEQCIGIKDSSGDVDKFANLVNVFSSRKNFGVLTGTGEQTLECMKAGADGLVPGLGALVPDLCVRMYHAGLEGNWSECASLQDKYIRLTAIYGPGREYWPGAQKTALKLLGIMNDNVASPYFRLNDIEKETVRKILQEEGVII